MIMASDKKQSRHASQKNIKRQVLTPTAEI
jgi:hypothetical protein